LELIHPAPLPNLYEQMAVNVVNTYKTRTVDKNVLTLNDNNRGDGRVANDYHGSDFARTSGIRFGSNKHNMEVIRRSS
jgi:hypothetical protein